MNAGEPPAFVDTNVLVYAVDSKERVRAPIARRLLDELITAQALRVSTQVLQETYVTVTLKIGKPLTTQSALHYLDRIAAAPITAIDYSIVRDAIELSASARLSFWDSLIVVAAARSGAAVLFTEDLQHGQTILGVKVINPFRNAVRPS